MLQKAGGRIWGLTLLEFGRRKIRTTAADGQHDTRATTADGRRKTRATADPHWVQDASVFQGLLANVQYLVGGFNYKIYEHHWILILWLRFVACMLA
jgi:hypothetical protein